MSERDREKREEIERGTERATERREKEKGPCALGTHGIWEMPG